MQLNAARTCIVTGLPIVSSPRSLYLETGWRTLAERRTKKSILMYKIVDNKTPSHLNYQFSSSINVVSNYNPRNNTCYDLPCSFETVFFFLSTLQ